LKFFETAIYFQVNAIIERGYAVFKSNEPAQVHVYHDKYCDPTLTEKQVESCKKSRASHFGSRQQLYKLWKKKNLQLIHSQRLWMNLLMQIAK